MRRITYGLAVLAATASMAALAMAQPRVSEPGAAARITMPLPAIGQPAQAAGTMEAASATASAPSRPAGLTETMAEAARRARQEVGRGTR